MMCVKQWMEEDVNKMKENMLYAKCNLFLQIWSLKSIHGICHKTQIQLCNILQNPFFNIKVIFASIKY